MPNPTKKYLFVYYGSGVPLPSDKILKNHEAWHTWNTTLNETYGIHVANGGSTVATDGTVSPYRGNLKGVSIIDAFSIEDAIEKAKNSPSVQFGGHVEVFAEF